jgi:hypothetical protein
LAAVPVQPSEVCACSVTVKAAGQAKALLT